MQVRLAVAAALLVLVSACAQLGGAVSAGAQPAQEFLPDGGPPVVNGFYEARQEMCSARPCEDLLATSPVVLRDGPHPDAAVVAMTTAGEWLAWVGEVYRMRPVRGVVSEAMEMNINQERVIRFRAGDIVYLTDEREDGTDAPQIAIWFRGDTIYQFTFDYEEVDRLAVNWDSIGVEQPDADGAAGAGWWV